MPTAFKSALTATMEDCPEGDQKLGAFLADNDIAPAEFATICASFAKALTEELATSSKEELAIVFAQSIALIFMIGFETAQEMEKQ
ncbi:MAG: hypothetical protein EBZ48_02795 [Proteobacteria bacterium]|nr:hypothetical protein [Pseudomonadota bacterium]